MQDQKQLHADVSKSRSPHQGRRAIQSLVTALPASPQSGLQPQCQMSETDVKLASLTVLQGLQYHNGPIITINSSFSDGRI